MPYANIEDHRAWRKRQYAANPEAAKQSVKDWRAANPERKRATARQWRSKNPSKGASYNRRFREEHPEQATKLSRTWLYKSKYGLTLEQVRRHAESAR